MRALRLLRVLVLLQLLSLDTSFNDAAPTGSVTDSRHVRPRMITFPDVLNARNNS